MRRVAIVVACLCAWSADATPAAAQSSGPEWRPWHPFVSIGGGWAGAESLGTVTAETRATGTGTLTPSPFTLFQTTSSLDSGPRAELALAVPVTPTLAVEIVGTRARPTLTTAISRDAESAPATTASEQVDDYTVGARLLYDLARWSIRGRARPFLTAGGAYLRQLHEDRVLVETGGMWTAGAGLRWWLLGARQGRALGVSTEVGWAWRTGGIAFTDSARSMPTASVRLFAGL